jgi:hypothetical protein
MVLGLDVRCAVKMEIEMWFVVFFCLNTHNLANIPVTENMSLASAAEIATSPDNWDRGFYGVARQDNPESREWIKKQVAEHPVSECKP